MPLVLSGAISTVEQTFRYLCCNAFHLIEKGNGIKYLYALLHKHPDVYANVDFYITEKANGCFSSKKPPAPEDYNGLQPLVQP
jgi:hypothetical protein